VTLTFTCTDISLEALLYNGLRRCFKEVVTIRSNRNKKFTLNDAGYIYRTGGVAFSLSLTKMNLTIMMVSTDGKNMGGSPLIYDKPVSSQIQLLFEEYYYVTLPSTSSVFTYMALTHIDEECL